MKHDFILRIMNKKSSLNLNKMYGIDSELYLSPKHFTDG